MPCKNPDSIYPPDLVGFNTRFLHLSDLLGVSIIANFGVVRPVGRGVDKIMETSMVSRF